MRWPAKRILTQAGKGFGMYERAAELEAGGADIIHLEVGRPSSDTPMHIKAAAKRALDDGIVHYGDLRGSLKLREALSEKLRRYNELVFEPDEILITNGLTQAAFATFAAAIDEGDEVIVFEPYYPQHNPKVALLGGRIVTVPLDKASGFRLDPAALKDAITPRTRMIVLINPANPVGTVFTRDELAAIAEIAVDHDLLVLSDEVYEYVIYDDARHVSIASLPGMRERTISTFAFTKAYSMDGWRIGYAAAPQRFIDDILKVTLNETTHPCVFAQEGALEATIGPQDCIENMVKADCARRDLALERLNAMPGVTCHKPHGSIYLFPDFSAIDGDSHRLAESLLEETRVAVEAGAFYGPAGEGHLRICYAAASPERLQEGLDRIADYVRSRARGAA